MSETIHEDTLASFNGDELAARCFSEKYALRDADGALKETTPDQMWLRLADELSASETQAKRDEVRALFNELLSDWNFVPGGRVMAATGSGSRSVGVNCYFTAIEEDSIEGIFDWCKSAARTYSLGGGNGVDIGGLRPRGSPVNNSARQSTGAVSFMELFSTTTGTIGQGGRRGALMITCPVDYPDVEEFIDIKRGNTDKVRYANISLKITDEFMSAAIDGKPFDLRFRDSKGREYHKVVDAAALWDKIVSAAHQSAEPGILFWDHIVDESPSQYCAPVIGTNPCGEQPLDHNGNCTLGHINLYNFVVAPHTAMSSIDIASLKHAVRAGVRFLDNVVEYNLPRHAHAAQTKKAHDTRRIGLGVTAFADMLVALGIRYDSAGAIALADDLFNEIKETAYDESVNLAIEKGPFPLFDADKHLAQPFIQRLSPELRERIRLHGLRNVCILTIAPVGSGSTLSQTSSGIEPIFALSYTRRSESLSQEFYQVKHRSVADYMGVNNNPIGGLPPQFVEAHDIDPFFRVRMQGTIQKHIDSAISSTINLPRDVSVETVKHIYEAAWKEGCKGMTVYREGSREGILITNGEKATEEACPLEGCGGKLRHEGGCSTCERCAYSRCSM